MDFLFLLFDHVTPPLQKQGISLPEKMQSFYQKFALLCAEKHLLQLIAKSGEVVLGDGLLSIMVASLSFFTEHAKDEPPRRG